MYYWSKSEYGIFGTLLGDARTNNVAQFCHSGKVLCKHSRLGAHFATHPAGPSTNIFAWHTKQTSAAAVRGQTLRVANIVFVLFMKLRAFVRA